MGAERARLQGVRGEEAARAQEEAERRAAEATAAALNEAEKKIKREMPPGGSRVDTVGSLLEGDSTSRMKMDLAAVGSQNSKRSGRAPLHRRKGMGKHPRGAQRPTKGHPHDSDRFFTCSDGGRGDRRHRGEPTGCGPGAESSQAVDRERAEPAAEKPTAPLLKPEREGLSPPYRSTEGTACRPLSWTRSVWDSDEDMGYGPIRYQLWAPG